MSVDLVYGEPVLAEFDYWRAVRPVEKRFGLLRYVDFEEHGFIYIARFGPSHGGSLRNAVSVPATPALHRVFDECLPRYIREKKLYLRRTRLAFRKAIERAKFLEIPEVGDYVPPEIEQEFLNRYNRFFQQLAQHMKIPKPLLVKVEGIEDVLDEFNIITV